AARRRPGLHRENELPHPCRIVCVKPLSVNGYRKTHQPVQERGDGNNRITLNYPIIAFGNCSR
ncbi:hypothetical protein, partial [Aeromonas sp. R6-2]|uniref:hypothetical protein n=1 Tax=Aeromonas sp. R6-2 TaxID=3138472 RepID=UPI0034A58C04